MANYKCARCHRFFEKVAFEEVCPTCFPIEENEFKRIKEYLSQHPGATSSEIMRELSVSLKSIRRYLKEDRLEIIGDNKGFLRCELCGTPVNSGRFCEGCFKEGQALRQKEAGIGYKGVYSRPDKKSDAEKHKGIEYWKNKD